MIATKQRMKQNAESRQWREYGRNPTPARRAAIVERYYHLAEKLAMRLYRQTPHSVDYDTLLSAAGVGLLNAVDSFDVSRGFKFATYAPRRIWGAMLDELRSMDWTPRIVRSRRAKINKAVASFEIELGRAPTADELAERLNVSLDTLAGWLKETQERSVVSLSTILYSDQRDVTIGDTEVIDQHADPATAHEADARWRYLLRGLNADETAVIVGRYREEKPMREIAGQIGLSESRIGQMHSIIIQRMRVREGSRERGKVKVSQKIRQRNIAAS